MTFGGDVFASAFLTIHQDEDKRDFAAFVFDGLDGLQGGLAGGDDVIDDHDGLGGIEIAFDAASASVFLGFLAHREGLHEGTAAQGGGDGDREGKGVGSQRESPDGGGGDAEAGGFTLQQVKQEASGENGAFRVESSDAAIDVEVALAARSQGEGTGFDGFGEQDVAQTGAVGFEGHGDVFKLKSAGGKVVSGEKRGRVEVW